MPCRCSAPSRLVTSPACESRVRACETDGRSAPTSRPSSRCVSGSARRMPPGSTRPQRPARCQSSSVSRTSRRGCEVIARWTSRSAARVQARESSAREICGHGLTALRERLVEQGEARRHQRVPGRARARAGRRRAAASGCRTSPSPTISVAVRSPTRHVDAERAVDDEHARPVADLGRSSARGRSRRRARRTRRRSRPAARRGACAGRARSARSSSRSSR